MRSKNTHKGTLVSVASRDGTPIVVSTAGNGPPLVCVDNALSTRSQGPVRASPRGCPNGSRSIRTIAVAAATAATRGRIRPSGRSRTSRP